MKKINCKHCQNSCKQIGKTECENYKSIASRLESLREEIRKAFNSGNYDLAKKLQDELFKFEHG
jgi:hypothetical protein